MKVEIKKIGTKYLAIYPYSYNNLEKKLVYYFYNFHSTQHGLKAFCEIENENGDLLLYGFVNLESDRSKNSFIQQLINKYPLPGINLQDIFLKICTEIRKRFKEGEPFVRLIDDEVPDKEPTFLLYPFLYKDEKNLFYGMGNSFKSFFALNCCKELSILSPNSKVLFLSYEDKISTIKQRAKLLGIPISSFDMRYRYCSLPITEEIDKIVDYCEREKIDFVIIDSLGQAIANYPLNDPESATNFYTCINALNATVLIIGHSPKEGVYPFGSIYHYNCPRNIWYIEAKRYSQYENYIILEHKKNNIGTLFDPIVYRVFIDEDRIEFKQTSIESLPDAEELLPTHKIIYNYLAKNPNKTTKEISEETGIKIDRVRVVLNRYKKMFIKDEEGKWSVQQTIDFKELRQKIFDLLFQNGPMTTKEIADKLSIDYHTIERLLLKSLSAFINKDGKWDIKYQDIDI